MPIGGIVAGPYPCQASTRKRLSRSRKAMKIRRIDCLFSVLFVFLGADAFAQEEKDSDTKKESDQTQELDTSRERLRLRDRVKSVQRKSFLKKSRFELFPYFGLDLNDPFFQHFIVGASGAYHLTDSLALELRGGFVAGSVKQSAIRFVRQETDSLLVDPPEFKYHADVDLQFSPIYGKISLFGESILHFDTYLVAGPGVFGTDQGANPAVNVGIGQRYFINRWLTARVELRDYIFMDNRNGSSDIQNLMIVSFSLSGFLPTTFDYEYR